MLPYPQIICKVKRRILFKYIHFEVVVALYFKESTKEKMRYQNLAMLIINI